MDELVSIILPVYNGERFLAESLDSIIAQTYQNWELIIIDDCSSDSSPEIAKSYASKDNRIQYFRNEQNIKLPKSLNRGFSLSKGEYLTWTSDDNKYLPYAIEKMIGTLKQEKTRFVFATCDVINAEGEIVEIWSAPKDYQNAIIGGNYVGACFLYTRTVYETIGEYNPDKFLVEDYDYWLRVFAKYPVSHIPEVLYQYRWHDGTLTSTERTDTINQGCERVILEHLPDYGKLSIIQKYYLYSNLHRLRKTRTSPEERDYYKNIARLYNTYYLFKYKIPYRIVRIFKIK